MSRYAPIKSLNDLKRGNKVKFKDSGISYVVEQTVEESCEDFMQPHVILVRILVVNNSDELLKLEE